MLKGDTGNACNSDISDPTGYYKARVLYTAGEKIQATNAMARYVTLTPALLDIIMHDTMLTADTAFMKQLQATLLADKPGKTPHRPKMPVTVTRHSALATPCRQNSHC